MARADCPRAGTLPPVRSEVRASLERGDGSSPLVDRGRDRGDQACRVRSLHPALPLLILVLLLLAGALGLVRFAARLKLSQIGLYPWDDWQPVEKSYFVQLLVIANVVFPLVFASRLRLILAQPSVVATVWSAFVPYLFFGFYQEVVYRGILQSEFVRRWGVLAGILGANVFYTFGPLHWYYFAAHGFARGPDVRGDLRDRSVLWCPVLEIGQSLDRRGHPWDR